MMSPEVIFTICRSTTAQPYHILKSLLIRNMGSADNSSLDLQPSLLPLLCHFFVLTSIFVRLKCGNDVYAGQDMLRQHFQLVSRDLETGKQKSLGNEAVISRISLLQDSAFTIGLLLLDETNPEHHKLTVINSHCGMNYLGEQMRTRRIFYRPILSYIVPLFQSESSCRTFHMKMSLICMKKNLQGIIFSYEWFGT